MRGKVSLGNFVCNGGSPSLRWVFALAVALAITQAGSASADELHLKNGDFISGHIVSMDEETVVIQTSYGKLTIDRQQVLSGFFSSGEPERDEALEVELLFDGDPDISAGSALVVAEYGIERAAGVDGKPESAIRSTGKGTYLALTGTPGLDSAGAVTISFWVFPREAGRLQYVLSKWDITDEGKADGKFAVGIRHSGLHIYLMDASGNYHLQSFDGIVPAETWTHLAVVFDQGRLTVYRNGELAGQRDLSFAKLAESSSPLYVMTARASTEDTWSFYNLKGMLDNLRIYSRALATAEIADLAGEM